MQVEDHRHAEAAGHGDQDALAQDTAIFRHVDVNEVGLAGDEAAGQTGNRPREIEGHQVEFAGAVAVDNLEPQVRTVLPEIGREVVDHTAHSTFLLGTAGGDDINHVRS